MAHKYESLSAVLNHGFDTVIDVRSPAEFAEDHVPGAINLPVLSNEERAQIGTIYVQQSQFLARKLGAALVFRNAAAHIEGPLKDRDGAWRPLVYCWRGGQRSGSFAWVLSQIGWRSEVIEGGYRSYRRLVNDFLNNGSLDHRVIVLDGYTGTAKTDLLHRLKARGVQTLDLEGLARHRGSILGATSEPQPSQKMFESFIAQQLCAIDPARPLLIEGESSKIGGCIIPRNLWGLMKQAPRIELTAPLAARTAHLLAQYDDILSDSENLSRKLAQLRSFRGKAIVDGWMAFIAAGDKTALTRALIEQHYDPAYERSRRPTDSAPLARVHAKTLDNAGQETAADAIAAALERWNAPG